MIKTELTMVGERQLRKTWSDAGYIIERDRAMYGEAVGPVEFDRVYTETDIPIEVMEDDIEKEGEYARDNFENCWKQYHSLGGTMV